jgi:two-component sensor histidine kinase
LLFALWGFISLIKIRKARKRIANQNVGLEQAVKDKELLLKEVHHRVKNNLQVVTGLLQIQSNRTDNEEVKDILEQSRGRIFSIATIHDLLYKDPDDQSVNASEYIDQVIHQNTQIQGDQHSFHSNTNGISLEMDSAIPIGLILNEMITNTCKHAFGPEENGSIEIELKALYTQKFQYSFSYKDNGKGFDKTTLDDSRKSLGLRLIDLMTEQIDGEMIIDTKDGVHYMLNF